MPSSKALAVHMQAVSYRYPQRDKVALADISYTFPTGTTAIVGPNGAGKSTLVKLLTGLLAPSAGAIGVQLPDGASVPPGQAQKAVLFQEPAHLYLTIRQNVTMRFDRTPNEDGRIEKALEIAGLRRVVDRLPDGLDTLVGAGFGGRLDLSGGQWQRLALARLIYQDAPVMILDEPVASLDPEGERAVFQLFAQLTQAKIIIFTTHRYDSIPRGTPIVVLVDGRLVETGTHEQLLERERHYWSLYVSGGTAARNALGQDAVRTAPEEKITAPGSGRSDGALAGSSMDVRDAVAWKRAVRNGGLRSRGHTLLGGYQGEPGVARQAAGHDREENLVSRGGARAPQRSTPEEGAARGANADGHAPEIVQRRGVQEGVRDAGWQSPEGEPDLAVRVAADRPRGGREGRATGGR